MPKSFESDLVLRDPEATAPVEATIAVNHPLLYKGYAIYQASFSDGGSKLARDMLPVFDNMKRAVEAASKIDNEASKPLIEGVELTMRSLLGIFEKHGIRLVSPEVGDRFDPEEHEAMFEAPVPNTKAGDIIQVMAEGFMIHDRLLRPAQVGVSSTPG